MEYCQRDALGNIIPQTWVRLVVEIIIDTSGSMGTYLPELVEKAVNRFFETIAESREANALIRVGVLESYSSVEVIAEFSRLKKHKLCDIRPGGASKLLTAIAFAADSLNEYQVILEQKGYVCIRPAIIIISDSPLDQNQLEELVGMTEIPNDGYKNQQPHFFLFTSITDHPLIQFYPKMETRIKPVEQLESAMYALAIELIDTVSVQQKIHSLNNPYNMST